MTGAQAITTRIIRCPRCSKSARYDITNKFRPFCTARCKDEDIVDWAEQRYGIPDAMTEQEDFPLELTPQDDRES